MEMTFDRNRLGVGLAVSLIVHLALLLFIALISSVHIKPVVPKSKDFFVEIFDGKAEKKSETEPREVKRFGRETSQVEKETVLPPSSSPHREASKPLPARPSQAQSVKVASSEEMKRDVPGEGPFMPEGLGKTEAEEAPKTLPGLNKLIPSYEQLAMSAPSMDMPKDVDVGNAVSLNTTEFKYISYFSKIKRQIQMVWRYPESARRAGLKGILTLKFSINEDGSLKGVDLLRSSGSSILDSAAVKAIRDAVPFFPLPKNLGEVLDVVANFEYELNGSYFR